MAEKNKIYETDFTKGVYKLEDFCNALKDNNCIVVRNVFNDWQALVDNTKYDSIRFVITAVHGEMKFGFWIACKHDLIITDSSSCARSQLAKPTDYAKQQWLDFFCLSKETEDVWERLLFLSAVKPVEKDYFDDKNHPSKQSFKIDEVIKIVRNSTYFDELSLIEAVSLRKDIFDLMDMVGFIEEVKYDAITKNWIAQYDGGMITMPSWIGNILDKEAKK